MEHKDLVFHKKVSGGRKSHYIFAQKNIFYVLTEQDEGSRGNFLAISKLEVENVKKQISENRIPGNFNCNDIYKKIKLAISVDKENPSYYVDRLTRVCYILCTQDFLELYKEANKVIFKIVYNPLIFSGEKSSGQNGCNAIQSCGDKLPPLQSTCKQK